MNKITDEELRIAIANPENQRMVRKVCSRYSGVLSPTTLRACGDAAVWRCLQSHKDNMGQKFTSSLYRFTHWECLREVANHKSTHQQLDEGINTEVVIGETYTYTDPTQSLIVEECLDALPQVEREIVIARFLEGRTLEDIGTRFSYSKQGVLNVLKRAVAKMKEIAIG